MDNLHKVITDHTILAQWHIFRHGFAFTAGSQSNVYDAIVIRSPENCDCWSPKHQFSQHSLEAHIDFINEHKLERAVIIAEDICFITRCPSLKYITLHIADNAPDQLDLSPLYDMPQIEQFFCRCQYGGPKELKSTTIDYSQMHGLRNLSLSGKGHSHFEQITSLEQLSISEDKTLHDLTTFKCAEGMKRLDLLKCSMESLTGIGKFQGLQWLSLSYMRTLADISELSKIGPSLRLLCFENCAKIKDFSALYDMRNLEHLELFGSNELPSLDFLNNMPKLKTFSFSMTVKDCDITPCLRVPYVWMKKGKRKYNLRPNEMPQNKTAGFELR